MKKALQVLLVLAVAGGAMYGTKLWIDGQSSSENARQSGTRSR